jgi:site-specific recombinase XerD
MTTISEGLQAYRVYAQAAGHSPRTIGWITGSVRYFSEFMGEQQDIAQITANDLRRFIINWGQRPKFANHPFNPTGDQPVSPISVQTYARGIRAFFGHLAAEELIAANPMQRVKTPKVPTKAVPTFSTGEVERLLRCPDRNTPVGFRDYSLMLTFVDTIARLSELCNLNEKDVDLEGGFLKVMGKGGKERMLPIGNRVCRAFLRYKLKYRPQPIGTEAFWLTPDGARLTPNRVEFRIRRYGKQIGLERCYPHKLRHTGSVMYLRNGGDPFSLQKILGHSSLQMTRHYCNLADTDVKQQHTKFGVADRLKI